MIRTLALTAAAALSIAAPAHAGGVRVDLAGKSQAQVEADVAKAARSVCFRATRNETLVLHAYTRCVKATTKASLDTYAMAQAPSNSALAAR